VAPLEMTSMPICFVIQPFDGDKFDRRFKETFSPAIKAAGLEAYRVDTDPGVQIPINDIERGIREADLCFAEITTDNPNVWFELGYAFALNKLVCMVCSKERDKAFPFDVRHRAILTYDVGSKGDFDQLGKKITQRLEAILKQEQKEMSIQALQPRTATAGLTPHEATALAILVALPPGETVAYFHLQNAMERAGFTNLAAGLSIRSLTANKLIESQTCYDHESSENYAGYVATEKGIEWIITHQDEFALRKPDSPF
jgi:nucleoside 2-deoxyribosyltransferase